jgi:hypothetical protein
MVATMTVNTGYRNGVTIVNLPVQANQTSLLGIGEGVLSTVALEADADALGVHPAIFAVSTMHIFRPTLLQGPILVDKIMVADHGEAAITMPPINVFNSIVVSFKCGRMDNDVLGAVFHYTEISMTKVSLTKSP